VWELRDYGFDLRSAFEDDRRNVEMLRSEGIRASTSTPATTTEVAVTSRAGTVTLRSITTANRAAVEALAVAPEQEAHVTGVVESLAEGDATPDACPWCRAVYADETPVGFVMLSDGIPAERTQYLGPYFLWRLLIDARYQGRGFGNRRARPRRCVRPHPSRGRAAAHVLRPGPAEPLAFYLGYGFVPTGAVDHGEPVLALPL
jgi:diamine N-acetyltransferase